MASQDEEFTSIFNGVYPSLCRFLECLLGERGVAQDITQESFLRMHRFGMYRLPQDEARFWLFRVARNLALNELSKARTRSRFSDQASSQFRGNSSSPEEDLVRAERNRMVTELLQQLAERQRAALLLREQEEMSYREIAHVLGISENSVKSDIFRARKQLRERWDEIHRTSARIRER